MIDASPPPPCPPPLIAAAFSLAAPPILFGSTGGIFFLPTPLGFGAGHALAGDWRRAGLVSAGGFAAMGTGALLGVGMNYLTVGADPRPRLWANPLVGTAVAMAGYTVWAGWDAYHTALRARPGTERVDGAP